MRKTSSFLVGEVSSGRKRRCIAPLCRCSGIGTSGSARSSRVSCTSTGASTCSAKRLVTLYSELSTRRPRGNACAWHNHVYFSSCAARWRTACYDRSMTVFLSDCAKLKCSAELSSPVAELPSRRSCIAVFALDHDCNSDHHQASPQLLTVTYVSPTCSQTRAPPPERPKWAA